MYFNRIILLLISFVFLSCDPETSSQIFTNKYGSGTYILTSNGLNFIKKNTNNINNKIFETTNNLSLQNPKSLLVYGSRLYVVANDFYSTDINSLQLLGQVNGFTNASNCAIIPQNRAFVSDSDESSVKLIDLDDYRIISEIETGENTSPSFIINKYDKSFVLNGGNNVNYDSTLITITYKDDLIPLADFSGNLIIGKNPSSAINSGNINVLCAGVFDESNPSNNIESSFYNIYPTDLLINFSQNLSGIYNADNLVETANGNNYYFTANDGIYRTNTSMSNVNLVIPIQSNVLEITTEKYAVNDSTDAYSNILYMNDINNSGSVYKYNINLSSFVDTISFDGQIIDIAFKN
tara:strand:- start:849 stop:1901 length:1053 start_codon:yes stop_codon:yes gene_type:complete